MTLPADLSADELAVIAQDYRTSHIEPLPPETIEARRRHYSLTVDAPRTIRRLASVEQAMQDAEALGSPWEGIAPPPLTYRTLADISDEAPGPLLLGMFEPDGPTLAYAAPGVGKGTSCAWAIVELQRAGMLPAVFDAERRPREWARRVGGLGGDRSRVLYIDPADLGRQHAGRPLWDSAPAIGALMKAAGADVLIVDSILPAVGVGEERLRSDAQAPYLYVGALDALGKPSLSLGHPPNGQPEGEPFGSFAWVAAMRMTWLGTRAEGDGHGVRWRPRKRNERGHVPGVLLRFDYGDDGRLSGASREDDEEQTREWLLYRLKDGPRTVADLADELLEEAEEHVSGEQRDRTKERLARTLNRMKRDGSVDPDRSGGRGVKWTLRWER